MSKLRVIGGIALIILGLYVSFDALYVVDIAGDVMIAKLAILAVGLPMIAGGYFILKRNRKKLPEPNL